MISKIALKHTPTRLAPAPTSSEKRRQELEDRFDQVKNEASDQAVILHAMAQRASTPAVSESLLQQALDSAKEVSLELAPLAGMAVKAAEIGWDRREVQNLRDAAHDKLQDSGALDGNPLAPTLKRHGSQFEQVSFLKQVANEDASIRDMALAVVQAGHQRFDDVNPMHEGLAKGVFQADPAYRSEAELLAATETPWYAPWRSRVLNPVSLIKTAPATSIGELADKAAALCNNTHSFNGALRYLKAQELSTADRKILELLEESPGTFDKSSYLPTVAGFRQIGEHPEFTDRTVVSVLGAVQGAQNGHFVGHTISGFAAQKVESPQMKAALEAFPQMTNYPSRLPESLAWKALSESPSDQDPVLALAKAASPEAVAAVERAMSGEFGEAPGEYIDRMTLRLLASDAADPKMRAAALGFAKSDSFQPQVIPGREKA